MVEPAMNVSFAILALIAFVAVLVVGALLVVIAVAISTRRSYPAATVADAAPCPRCGALVPLAKRGCPACGARVS